MLCPQPSLVWLRRNFRVEDNLSLKAATDRGDPVIPVFILEEKPLMGSAARWWLAHSLRGLQKSLRRRGLRLILRKGDPLKVLESLIKEAGAGAVFWDRSFEPVQRAIDEKIRSLLRSRGISCEAVNDVLLFDPARIVNKQGTPFKVFTPFWNHCLSLEDPLVPVKLPARFSAPAVWPRSEKIESMGFEPREKWAAKMEPFWKPGATGGLTALRKFLSGGIEEYPCGRDHLAEEGTSKLSPHLHFGEVSTRQVWHEARRNAVSNRRTGMARASEAFLRQIVWREFAHYQLFHFPETVSAPLRKEFSRFSWKKDMRLLRAWQKGETGYPVVDAGMRQLWKTGWMHNRARMIVASFLVKDLLIDWREGAAWFMETLVDADLANNTFGWQWVAGCGADAAPYFRIFNPMLQGGKFDPAGAYVRRWVPELSKVPARYIHAPWKAPAQVLAKAGVRIGKTYPEPVVDHDAARKRALFVYSRMRKKG